MSEMNKDVFVVADNVFTPLGKTTSENFEKLKQGKSAIKQHHDPISPQSFYAALFENETFSKGYHYTKFEQIVIASVAKALQQSGLNAEDEKTVFILSSTKGNISLIETEKSTPGLHDRVSLSASAKLIAEHFGFVNQPIVISNACVSGVVAIITGMRLLRTRQYENAIIAGADVISEFILSGFQSFQALSPGVCKPFDKDRDGLNLGEGAGTIILSSDPKYAGNIKVLGGGISNDANHISGPSRTGKELSFAIDQSLKDANISIDEIGFISAHGTATPYNDEMEANAIALSGLELVPLNSLKANYGHTLGAAGLIESIVSVQSLKENLILPTAGFEERGVTKPVNVARSVSASTKRNFLKTASGFGGCNAAIIFGK
ncbi:MAG TPA: beta-ketoacyl synthase N-terminal-like domain-containing protein [Mucilaginibacter sp.]|nr:beta-ketoacyl synthase N-terminal-like domain-containing protein [Mucilaginibacter sp.]